MSPNSASGTASAARAPALPALLLIDDDPLIVDSLKFVLEDSYHVHAAANRAEAKAILRKLPVIPGLALVDLGLPPTPHTAAEGFALVEELLAFNPAMKILVLSGQSSRANIQHALTLGAVDFIPKPADALLLKARLSHQQMMLEAEQPETAVAPSAERILGRSPAMQTLRALIRQFGPAPFPVLLEGESGSGKELVAQALHSESERANGPFLAVNCAAFTGELLESQLFGHARGAFTGADSAKAGFFEQAGAGTLLLDEIGEFPLPLQAKLLRVLENGEYYRIGETDPRVARARIIAATNRDLREEVRIGRFRQDLYHRLSVLTVRVPPLRERDDDCLLLLQNFRDLYATKAAPFALAQEAEQQLREYSFPGNVRELRNIVIRLGAKYAGRTVGVRELAAELESDVISTTAPETETLEAAAAQEMKGRGFTLDQALAEWERRYINVALRISGGNLSKAARLLGVNRTTLYSRLQRLSIKVSD
ncbi:MAG: sigma-54-dependent transcriptional regulator [Chromatiales bacterium]